jgi:hypothetical protein
MESSVVALRVLIAAFALMLTTPCLVDAAEQAQVPSGEKDAQGAEPTGEEGEAPPPPNLECHGEPVEGSGTGFMSSQELSEEAAIAAWLELAKKQDPLTKWETAGKAGLSCVKQGLFSKCFAIGVPCHIRK